MSQFFFAHFFELLAVTTGLLNIYLAARANVWNWFFGIITTNLYLIIFFKAGLYADMSLQLIFFCLQFYGLYQWLYGGKQHTALVIRRANKKIFLSGLIAALILFVSIAFILKNYTNSTMVYLDAFTTALSVVAQWMMSKKWLEHWWLWMVINVFSISMYISKNLYFTSGLYAIFFLLCILGYYTWRKQLEKKDY